MARIEVLEIAALLEAMETEERNQPFSKTRSKQRPKSVVGRVLSMAHQLGRGSIPLTDPSVLKPAVN